MFEPRKPTKNVKGKVLSIFAQDKENDCIEAVYLKGVKMGKFPDNNLVHCADGIMQLISTYSPSDCEMYSEAVFEATGFRMKFSVKEMDKGYDMKTLNNHILFDFIYKEGWSTSSVAEYFKYLYCHERVSVNRILYYYNGHNWEQDDDSNTNTIMFVDEVFHPLLKSKFCAKQKALEAFLEDKWLKREQVDEEEEEEEKEDDKSMVVSEEQLQEAMDVLDGKDEEEEMAGGGGKKKRKNTIEATETKLKKLKKSQKVVALAEKQKKSSEKEEKEKEKQVEAAKKKFQEVFPEFQDLTELNIMFSELGKLKDNKSRK